MAQTNKVTKVNKQFAVFILTNGRPDNVVTYQLLRQHGYTGKVYFIVDDEDLTISDYQNNFGKECVIQFSKEEAEKLFDLADTRKDRRAVSFARNATFGIAEELGLDYFIQLDDDNDRYLFRWVEDNKIKSADIKSLDKVFQAMIDLLEDTGSTCVAMSQGGDHFGGVQGNVTKPILRKAMNTLMLKTSNPIEFIGRINNDVNTYVVHGSRGHLFLTTTVLHANQIATQQNAGGMTESHKTGGTYLKSMYSVIMAPSCVTVRVMGSAHQRLHHHISWENAVPKIISGRHKKH
jgi:hypothetical protein